MCAASILEGPTVVAYADTLIRADLSLDPTADAVIWVKEVEQVLLEHSESLQVTDLHGWDCGPHGFQQRYDSTTQL